MDDPPLQKFGNADNSHGRYNLARAPDWTNEFPTVVNTAGETVAQFQPVGRYLCLLSFTEPWLFGWHDHELLDVVELLNRGLLADDRSVSLGWLAFPELMFLSLGDARFSDDLRVAIDQRGGHTLALNEVHLVNRIAEAGESSPSENGRRSGSI